MDVRVFEGFTIMFGLFVLTLGLYGIQKACVDYYRPCNATVCRCKSVEENYEIPFDIVAEIA